MVIRVSGQTVRSRASMGEYLHVPQAMLALRLIDEQSPSYADLQEALGLSRPTTYRMLAQLQLLGVVVDGSDGALRVRSWGGLRKAWVLEDGKLSKPDKRTAKK